MFSMSLDCPFLIAHSVFSNIYLMPPLVIGIHVPSQNNTVKYACMTVVSNLPFPLIFLSYFETFPSVWHFLFFLILFLNTYEFDSKQTHC